MKQYLDMMQHVLDNGTEKGDRTGTGTLSVFGHQMRFDLSEGFPMVTTKKLHLKSINTIDQITHLVDQIKNNPDSRRHIVSAWNVSEVNKMALPPCHTLFQFYVADGKLSCQLYQRSADIFLGVPFNIASYSLLTMMMAQVCDLEPGDFVHTFGDAHIYSNHIDQANEQLQRTPKALPTMKMNPDIKDIFGFTFDDFELLNYEADPNIKAPIAV